jgi:hypothetical protein
VSRWFPDPIVFRLGDAPRVSAALASAFPVLRPDTGDAASPAAAVPEPTWLDVTLSAFERELDHLDLKRGTRIACIVAGDAARYRIVPWSDELPSTAQRQVLAEHCFKEVYGEVAQGWTVRQHTARYGAATLACALDAAWLARLDALLEPRKLKLVSVQPSLMHAFNEAAPRPHSGPYWFVCIDALWATALLMSPTEPLHVKQVPCAGLDLARSLDREELALGLEAPRCPVHAMRCVAGMAHRASPGKPRFSWCTVDLHGETAASAVQRRAA